MTVAELERDGWSIVSRYWSTGEWTATAMSRHGAISNFFEAATRERALELACDWAGAMQRMIEGGDTERPAAEAANG